MSRWIWVGMFACGPTVEEASDPPTTASVVTSAPTVTQTTTATPTTPTTTTTDTPTTDTGATTSTSSTPIDTAEYDSAAHSDTADTADTGWTSSPCLCDDGLFCNGVESCDDKGRCVEGVAPDPEDDGDPCTRPTVCNEDTDAWDTERDISLPACATRSPVPSMDLRDYAFHYWNNEPHE